MAAWARAWASAARARRQRGERGLLAHPDRGGKEVGCGKGRGGKGKVKGAHGTRVDAGAEGLLERPPLDLARGGDEEAVVADGDDVACR